MNGLELTSVSQLKDMGSILAASNMFGTKNPNECIVIAGMCQQEGISYMEFMRKYHMISGRVSMRADAMLAEFQRMGGKYKIVQRDPDGAIIDLDYNGAAYTSRCIWEEIRNEDFVIVFDTKTGQRKVKDNYTFPRKRMQMLWARAVSDGVRVVCPQVVQGVYTPEEVADFAPTTTRPTVEVVEAKISPPPQPAATVQPTPAPAAPAAPVEPVAAQPAAKTSRRKVAPKQGEPIVDIPSPQPAATVQPAPAAAAPQPAPAPAAPAAADADAMPTPPTEDITRCPLPGKLKGVPWKNIEIVKLKWLLNNKALLSLLSPGHIETVSAIVAAAEKEGK